MAKNRPDLIVGLDIGTTEIRCLIGAKPTVEDKKFHILGLGCALNEGMRGGVIVNYDEAIGAIDSAIRQAELNAGHQIESLTVNINGTHLRAVDCQAEVAVSNSDRVVSGFDRDLVDRKAKELHIAPNRSIVQFFPNTYWVDQVRNLENPLGIQGNVLGVQALAISGLSAHVKTLERIFEEIGIRVNNKTVSSLAAAEAIFDKRATESGVAVADIGHSTTNLIIINEGKIEHMAVIPLGGFNATKDIAIVLQVDLDVAEFLKVNHADLNYQGRGTKTVEFNRQSINFSPQDLSEVTEARFGEICEFVGNVLKEKGFMQKIAGGIILTGGASQTQGLVDLFQDNLGIHTRLGEINNFGGLVEMVERKPSYLTVAGILALDYILQAPPADYYWERGLKKGLRFWDLFKRRLRTTQSNLRQPSSAANSQSEKDEDGV